MAEYYDMGIEENSVELYDINVSPNDFNVLTIYSLLEKSVITMPTFQRNYVWDRKRASKFIESLILGLPVPQIFLYQTQRNKYSVIDGQQRLMSIYFFMKQRFPRSGKRAFLRREFDDNSGIPDKTLADNQYFQEFKLTFAKLESGAQHPLSGKKYLTLDESKRASFELMPIRCMSIRQNQPENDNGSMYEIFSRLNTGGLNLSPQEIRGCLYNSPFYDELYKLNMDVRWRKLLGKNEPDDKFRDVEIILRSFALLYNHAQYTGAMIQFLNKFSKNSQKFDSDEIQKCEKVFNRFLDVIGEVNREIFLTRTGSFNVSFFDSIFVAVCEQLKTSDNVCVKEENLNLLKADQRFDSAITHSTSHKAKVDDRLSLAKQYLFGEKSQ